MPASATLTKKGLQPRPWHYFRGPIELFYYLLTYLYSNSVRCFSLVVYLTIPKAATSGRFSRCLAARPHALLMVVHEVVGTQHNHVPGSASQLFFGADYELLERATQGSLGPSDTEAILLQLGIGRQSGSQDVKQARQASTGPLRTPRVRGRETKPHLRARKVVRMYVVSYFCDSAEPDRERYHFFLA